MGASGLLYLRRRRLAHRLGRHYDQLRLIFDFWSTVIYAFALAVFGPGVYLYWRNPPALPEVGLALLGYWPALALVLAWVLMLGQGLFSAAGKPPLAFSRPDLSLLLPSPVGRRLVLAERFLAAWWQRFSGPAGLVLLFGGLTAGYGKTPWLQVGYLVAALAPLALGALGLSVAVFSLGPTVARALLWVRRAGQVLGVGLVGLALLFAPASAVPRGSLPTADLPPLDLSGAFWPALLFAALALLLSWALAGRRDLALWAGGSPDEEERPSARHASSTPAGAWTGPAVWAWKYLAVMRKVSVWEWLSRFVLPVAGAAVVGLAGRAAGVIAAAFAAMALLQAATFLARPLAHELGRIDRVRSLPVRLDHFLLGMLAPLAALLLGPSLLVWLVMGAGWAALVGAPATVIFLAVLAFQHQWAQATALGPAGKFGPSDSLFAYAALVMAIVMGEQALRQAPGAGTLALLSLVVSAAAMGLLVKLRTDLYLST